MEISKICVYLDYFKKTNSWWLIKCLPFIILSLAGHKGTIFPVNNNIFLGSCNWNSDRDCVDIEQFKWSGQHQWRIAFTDTSSSSHGDCHLCHLFWNLSKSQRDWRNWISTCHFNDHGICCIFAHTGFSWCTWTSSWRWWIKLY